MTASGRDARLDKGWQAVDWRVRMKKFLTASRVTRAGSRCMYLVMRYSYDFDSSQALTGVTIPPFYAAVARCRSEVDVLCIVCDLEKFKSCCPRRACTHSAFRSIPVTTTACTAAVRPARLLCKAHFAHVMAMAPARALVSFGWRVLLHHEGLTNPSYCMQVFV